MKKKKTDRVFYGTGGIVVGIVENSNPANETGDIPNFPQTYCSGRPARLRFFVSGDLREFFRFPNKTITIDLAYCFFCFFFFGRNTSVPAVDIRENRRRNPYTCTHDRPTSHSSNHRSPHPAVSVICNRDKSDT